MARLNTQKRYKSRTSPCTITPEPYITGSQWVNGIPSTIEVATPHTSLPEIQLLYAMIERAWFDLTLTDHNSQREAAKWITSKKHDEWSFLWVCDHLRFSSAIKHRLTSYARRIRRDAKELALPKDEALPES